MERHFTHYWTNKTWRANQRAGEVGELLDFTAGNLFRARGVSEGDYIYVVTVLSGRLYLCGKMRVWKICGEREALRVTGWPKAEIWKAKEYPLASHATPMRFEKAVPLPVTARMKMANGRTLTFKAPGLLHEQTLRGVRELSPESAAALDRLLLPLYPVEFPGVAEGKQNG